MFTINISQHGDVKLLTQLEEIFPKKQTHFCAKLCRYTSLLINTMTLVVHRIVIFTVRSDTGKTRPDYLVTYRVRYTQNKLLVKPHISKVISNLVVVFDN